MPAGTNPETPSPGSRGFEQPAPSSHLLLYTLSSRLPAPADLVNPEGTGEAIRGTVIPLSAPTTLGWERIMFAEGEYTFMLPDSGICYHVSISRGRRAVVPLGLDSTDEEKWALGVDLEISHRLKTRALEISLAWDVQSELTAGDPRTALRQQLAICDLLAGPTHAAVFDVEGRRYFLKGGWRWPGAEEEFDIRDHVSVHLTSLPGESGRRSWCHTHGMLKFGRAEMEIYDVAESLREAAADLLWHLGGLAIAGPGLSPLDQVGGESFPMLVRKSMRSPADHFQGPVFELVDLHGTGRPAEKGAPMALAAQAAAGRGPGSGGR